MGIISFGEYPTDDWSVARWAYRGYLEHVRERVQGDSELEFCIDQAIALDGLHFPLLDEQIIGRLAPILRRVADEVVTGQLEACVEGSVLDERSQIQFRQAVGELRALINERVSIP